MFKKFTISVVLTVFLAVTAQAQVYRANLTQTGTDAPVATVFENTFSGPIVWTRISTGSYRGTLTGAFPLNRTFILLGHLGANLTFATGNYYRATDNSIVLTTRDVEVVDAYSELADGLLHNTSIEIRAYPNN